MKNFKAMRNKLSEKIKYAAGNLNYAQDLDLAQKNMARLAKQEKGQGKKDYMAVARALNQGNLGAVKKIIKSISTDEVKADILNVLVGYNNLIAKMYPKAVDSKGRLKTPMNVSKMIGEAVKMRDILRKHKRELQKAKRTGNLELSKKAEDDLYSWAFDNGEIQTDDPDDFINWLDSNLDDILKGKIK